MAGAPLPIAVLASGTGTNLQALLDTVHGREAEVVAVASSVAGAPALERAGARRGAHGGVSSRGDHPDRGARDGAMADWLAERGARLVVLAGYMELLGEPFLSASPVRSSTCTRRCCPPSRVEGDRAGARLRREGVRRDRPLRRRRASTRAGDPAAALELPDAREPEEVLAALRPLEHALLPRGRAPVRPRALRFDPENPRRVLLEGERRVGIEDGVGS